MTWTCLWQILWDSTQAVPKTVLDTVEKNWMKANWHVIDSRPSIMTSQNTTEWCTSSPVWDLPVFTVHWCKKNLNGSHYFSLSFLLRLPLSVSHKTTHVCALANPACPHRRVLSLNPPNNPMILCAYNPLAMLLPDLTVPRGMGGGAHGVGRDLSRRVMEAVTSGIRQSGLIRM